MRQINRTSTAPTSQVNSRSRTVKLARGRVPTYSDHTADATVDMLAQVLYDAGVSVPLNPIADARADAVANAHVRLRALIGTVIGQAPLLHRKAKAGRIEDNTMADTELNDNNTPHSARLPGDPMPDNEEELQAAEARRAGKRVVSSIPYPYLSVWVMLTTQNGRKQKPLTRDFDGQWGQTLAVAKLQLFAYALAEAPYQTRETYLAWAQVVFEIAWFDEFPKQPFRQPPAGIYEVVGCLGFLILY
jgi:hypothetical protein